MARQTNGGPTAAAVMDLAGGVQMRGSRLLTIHAPTRYSEAEQGFSTLLQQRLDELLRGERNALMLMRKYPDEPGRLGVMATPAQIDPRGLRIGIVEQLIRNALLFLHADPYGGPTSQDTDGNGSLIEIQKFTTKFPHIVIERTDTYDAETERPVRIQWCASRVQNQRAATRINRMLDAANLGIDIAKLFL